MDLQTLVSVMLVLAAAAQIAAAIFALLAIPVSRMRHWWLILCVALVLEAYRAVALTRAGTSPGNAIAALAVGILLLVGVIGIRSVFVSLRELRRLLERERDRDNTFVNDADALVVVLDEAGRIRDVSGRVCRILHCDAGDVLGRDWFDTFVAEEAREKIRDRFIGLMASPDINDEYVEYALTDTRGSQHTCVWHRRVLRDADGRAVGVRSAGIDLTGRRALERELTLKSLLLDRTTDAVLAYRLDGTIVYANDTACLFRGLPRETIVGGNIRELISAEERVTFDNAMRTVAQGTCVTFETVAVSEEGISRPLESHVCPIPLGNAGLAVDVARDITERRHAEATIRRMAYTDHLTGLANRLVLYDRAKVAFARARRNSEQLALLFVDMDDLKGVNDTLGHAAGDELLCAMADRLVTAFRAEDTVARIGGDEFVVLAAAESSVAAARVAERLEELMGPPYFISAGEVEASASVGVAVFPDDGEDIEALLLAADASMYEVKGEHRSRSKRRTG